MRDVIVLMLAAGIAGGLVWRLSAGPGGSLPRTRRRVRFDETLEVTAIPLLDAGVTSGSIAFEESPVDPPRRTWAAVRLVLLIVTVAGIGATLIYAVGHFVRLALDSKLAGP